MPRTVASRVRHEPQSASNEASIFRACISPVSFWPINHLGPQNSWLEHAPFAFWLVEALRPRTFVELGTHGGFSYFTFCQAVQQLRIPAKCFAIDSWKGDEHSGFYGEEVYLQVRNHNDSHYSGFSRLIRSSFDEALTHFSDGSIDLLHIDGRHFYDDVKHDFESWESKLSTRSVVLFHDVNVRERGFGVFKLWERLSRERPHFEFLHGHGLGVLGVGDELPKALGALFSARGSEKSASYIRNAYSRLGAVFSLQLTSEQQASELAQRRTEIDLLRKDKAEVGHLLESSQRANSELSAALDMSSSELIECQTEIKTLQTAATVNAAEARRLLDLAQRDVAELRAALEWRGSELIECQTEIKALRTAATVNAAEVDRLLARAHKDVAELSATIKSQNAELAECKAEADVFRKAAAENAAEGTRLLTFAQSEASDLSAALAKSKLQLDELIAERAQIQPGEAKLRRELDATQQRVTHLEEVLQAREAKTIQQLVAIESALAIREAELTRFHEGLAWRVSEQFRSIAVRFPRLARILVRGPKKFSQLLQLNPKKQTTQQRMRDLALIESSRFFDRTWYFEQYSDVYESNLEPAWHYLMHGAKEGRNPGPLFDGNWYLAENPDVRNSGVNPLLHFLRNGVLEGRTPNPLQKVVDHA